VKRVAVTVLWELITAVGLTVFIVELTLLGRA